MDNMEKELRKLIGSKTSEVISQITGEETENTTVEISKQNVTIPAGFTISEESAETVDGGIVVVDKVGNEWVWVPCTEAEFARKDFVKQSGSYSDYSETKPLEQVESIKNHGGFYIGRYEAGDKETTALGKQRGEEGTEINTTVGDATNTVVIKKNQAPYNYVKIDQCKTLSSNFANSNGYDANKMFTVLCSSYAWDRTLTFIEKNNAGYGGNSTQGNYSDTNFVSGSSLINTGLTTPVCNIYDMGGNLWEYTTESFSLTTYPYVIRGGDCGSSESGYPAGYRSNFNGIAHSTVGFRPTLFLK